MKKFLALLAAVSLLVFAGSAFATTITANPASVFLIVGDTEQPVVTVTTTEPHEGGTLTYEKFAGPDWAEFSGNTVTFAPGSTVPDNTYTVTIRVTDTYPDYSGGHPVPITRTEVKDVNIPVTVYNVKPVGLTAVPTEVPVTAGTTTATVTLTGTPGNGGTITDYSLGAGPTWVTPNGNRLTIEPGADVSANEYSFMVRATETFTTADGVERTAKSEALVIKVNVSAYVVPITPVDDTDSTTGNEESKTSEPAEASGIVTDKTKEVTTTTTETRNTYNQTFTDVATASAKVVTTTTKETTTQTVSTVTETIKIPVTTDSTNAANAVFITITLTETTETKVTASEATTQFLDALTGSSTTTTTTTTQETKSTQQAIGVSLLKGKTDESGSTAPVDTSFLTNMAKVKDDGTTETPSETFLRILEETIETAARVLDATNPETANKLRDWFASLFASFAPANALQNVFYAAADDLVQVVNSTALQNVSFTKDDGTETDEALELNEVMPMLVKQALQEVVNTEEGTEARAKADAKLAELQNELPVVVTTPVALSDDAETSIVMLNLPLQKPAMYGKKIKFRALKQAKASKFQTAAFMPAAFDTTEDGTGVFLNSIGQEVDTIPGEGQWGIPTGETEERLVIPGQITAAILMKPGVVYVPVVTTPVEELDSIEGVSATTEEREVSVNVTTVEVVTIAELPVYDNASYSTSFDEALEAYFEAQGYDTGIGEFIVPGETGLNVANTEADTTMLVTTNRAVVQTLPRIAPMGATASDVARYVLKMRYNIPKDTETTTISSADVVLAFWPNGLVTDEGAIAVPGEALFLNASGDAALTASMVRRIAKGELGEAIDENTQGYTGYIVMTLAKLSADDEWYKPVITVKREAVTVSSGDEPGPGPQPGTTFTVTASPATLTVTAGGSTTFTLSPVNAVGTVSYTANYNWVSFSGNTARITAPSTAGTYPIVVTATDAGRTTNATATAGVTLTVTSGGITPTPGPNQSGDVSPDVPANPGGSSGGCDAGFGVLALAVLGGFIAARKK